MALLPVSWLVLLPGVFCVIPEHEIKQLPGWREPFQFRMWSGYIPVKVDTSDTNIHVHYWLVECTKGLNNAPIVAWYQGGPGGSSLLALFTENGPLTLNDDSFKSPQFKETGIPEVFSNPNSWHLEANMLYVEHPAPTGFSYCEPTKCPRWNDTLQAIANYRFLIKFFEAYPELSTSDFYLSGESYAGVLVPTVALQILDREGDYLTSDFDESSFNEDYDPWSNPWNLKGFAVGNACPGNRLVGVDFRYGHGMISDETYIRVNEACKNDWGRFDAPRNKTCRKLLGDDPARPVIQEAGDTFTMGGGYYLYDHCGSDLYRLSKSGLPEPNVTSAPPEPETLSEPKHGVYPCGQERATNFYLNQKVVQEAINVKPGEFSFITPLHYNFTKHSLLDDYKQKLNKRYRILQYSGDADPCVPHVGTKRWIDSLEMPVKEPWRPWKIGKSPQVAGYTTVFETSASSFTFATVRNAGHMVPRYKPVAALQMFKNFLNDYPL
ncbi:hypothetical protein AAMO2058_000157800 [Amorphochlora amoebiformis]